MKKSEAIQKAIQKKKDNNDLSFERQVESLIWAIENKSKELRYLKKELTELTYEEVTIPDVSDCIKEN